MILEEFIRRLIDYISSNQLVIDKGTYLTIVIGQITVYVMLLTFYQFIISFQGMNNKNVLSYLGVNLIECYVKKKLVIYNWIISKQLFGMLFVLEILYKPIISIYNKIIPHNIITILNFCWYAYVIFFFVMFVLLFFQCTKCILSLKNVVDVKRNANIVKYINNNFRKKTFIELLNKCSIDKIIHDMECLKNAIIKDNDPRLQSEYSKLFIQILDDYENNKYIGENSLLLKKKVTKEKLIYIMDKEYCLLKELIEGQYLEIDDILETYIMKLHLNLLKSNMEIALVEERENIFIDGCLSDTKIICYKNWNQLTKIIFKKSNINNKKKLIEILYEGYCSNNKLFKNYCEEVLLYLIQESVSNIFEEKMEQINFVFVFKDIMINEKINDFFANELRDNLISYNRISILGLIELLSKANCTYIFVYLIIYYSIYRFRFGWEYINVAVLKALKKRGEQLEIELDRINNLISKSNISHRYRMNMLITMKENLDKEITGRWLENICQQKDINAFYIIVVKLCVLEQKYCPYYEKAGIESKIYFINELIEHNEIISCDNVKEMILQMKYNDFHKLTYIPKKLRITLHSLLFMEMSLTDSILDSEIRCWDYISIGQYLLINLSQEKRMSEMKKELVKKAYISSNMSIHDYVEYLYNESDICGIKLNYVKKEKMKDYLIKII